MVLLAMIISFLLSLELERVVGVGMEVLELQHEVVVTLYCRMWLHDLGVWPWQIVICLYLGGCCWMWLGVWQEIDAHTCRFPRFLTVCVYVHCYELWQWP